MGVLREGVVKLSATAVEEKSGGKDEEGEGDEGYDDGRE